MKLKIRYDITIQIVDLTYEDEDQLWNLLMLGSDEGLSQTEREKKLQEAFDAKFNDPDYRNWRKHRRHTVSLGIKDHGNQGNDDDSDIYDPLLKHVIDDRIFRADELALEVRDSYESICRRIRSALTDKPHWAEAFIAVRLDGVSVNDYAAAINVSSASVVSHWLNRAKKKLKKLFQNRQI